MGEGEKMFEHLELDKNLALIDWSDAPEWEEFISLELSKEFLRKSQEALSIFPESRWKSSLMLISDFVVNRCS